MAVYKLINTVQNYPWGSRTALPSLLGMANPGGRPQAELWMGAHPKAPSRLEGPWAEPLSLEDYIAGNPLSLLGGEAAKVSGEKLPFLFKVLAADSPLSIQAHPSQAQAQAQFADEEAAGIPFDAFHRNYKDPHHKPEILCALTPFFALSGFRPSSEIFTTFRRLGPAGEALTSPPDLRSFFKALMEGGAGSAKALIAAALKPGALDGHNGVPWVSRLAKLYPGDVGVLAPLYLNVVSLTPGEAIYIPAGELHAYLEGTGIELMASSDNVLRGGLTRKHLDIPELLSVLSFQDRRPSRVIPRRNGPLTIYPTPAREFLLSRVELGGPPGGSVERPAGSCEILLTLSGPVTLIWKGGRMTCRRGESCFIGADTGGYRIEGRGEIFAASVPPPRGEGG